jgi:hypothetical protein
MNEIIPGPMVKRVIRFYNDVIVPDKAGMESGEISREC